MRITYDSRADAAYIYVANKIAKGGVRSTVCVERKGGGDICLDFDKSGKLLGIELIPGSALLSKALLKGAEQLELGERGPELQRDVLPIVYP